MAIPERIRKIIENLLIEKTLWWVFWKKTIPQAKMRITTVLMAVARLESTFFIPIFARMAVRAAKTAERKAKINQFIGVFYQKEC